MRELKNIETVILFIVKKFTDLLKYLMFYKQNPYSNFARCIIIKNKYPSQPYTFGVENIQYHLDQQNQSIIYIFQNKYSFLY